MKQKYRNIKFVKIFTCMMAPWVAIVSQPAPASSWYLGAGLGSGKSNFDSFILDKGFPTSDGFSLSPGLRESRSSDSQDQISKLFGGLNINNYFSIELGSVDFNDIMKSEYALLATDSLGSLPAGTDIFSRQTKMSADGLYSAAIGKIPLGSSLNLQARIGIFHWGLSTEQRLSGYTEITSPNWMQPLSQQDSGSDSFYGISISIGWLALSYEKFSIETKIYPLLSEGLSTDSYKVNKNIEVLTANFIWTFD